MSVFKSTCVDKEKPLCLDNKVHFTKCNISFEFFLFLIIKRDSRKQVPAHADCYQTIHW